jgi:two-component sensor histidine kinase
MGSRGQHGAKVPLGLTGRQYSLRAHLIVFGAGILIPAMVLAGLLLARSATLERAQLEARLIQVADDLGEDIDRDIARDFTLLQTLATAPSFANEDWPAFHTHAKAALQGKAYVVLIDSSLRQLVNTYVPYGSQPELTGDPETAQRMIASKQSDVSDLFVSLVTEKPVFNVNIPILRNGEVRYILHLGQFADDLVGIMRGQRLGPEWTAVILDRKGVVLARSRDQERFVGRTYPQFASDVKIAARGVIKGTNLDGEQVLRAVVRSKQSGWFVTAGIPLAMAEAPLRRSLWQWGASFALTLALATGLAWLFARAMDKPMEHASRAAAGLGRNEPIVPLRSSLAEANTITAALEGASAELAQRSEHQRLLLNELSHRVKNVLAVVQALVMRTLPGEHSMSDARDILIERLHALGRAHELLTRTDWKGAALKEIVTAELAPFSARVQVQGPELIIDGKMVQTFALVLHELATNASKYGSLSDPNGKVSITWSVTGAGNGARFKFRWEESAGPVIKPPSRKGFGSSLLEAALPADLSVKPRLAFDPGGFVYEIEAPLSSVCSSLY